MDIEQAREIVYGFANILGGEPGLIGDSSILPWSRATIDQAFSVYLSWMEFEKSKDPASFIRAGYETTLTQARKVMLSVDDFHVIAPEDKEGVKRVNSLPKWSHLDDAAMELMIKYPVGQGGDF